MKRKHNDPTNQSLTKTGTAVMLHEGSRPPDGQFLDSLTMRMDTAVTATVATPASTAPITIIQSHPKSERRV